MFNEVKWDGESAKFLRVNIHCSLFVAYPGRSTESYLIDVNRCNTELRYGYI